MTGRRDSYAVVGAATRQAIERAMPGLTLREAKVLLAIVSCLTSWSRIADYVTVEQVVELTGMDVRHVSRTLHRLADRGVILYVPGGSPKGGRRYRSRILLPPATVAPGQDDGPPATANTDPRPRRTLTPGHGGPPSEKYPRTNRGRGRARASDNGAGPHRPVRHIDAANLWQLDADGNAYRPTD